MKSDNGITHPLNVTYLVVGLVFLGIAGTWALRSAGLANTREMGWLIPLMLVSAGAVGLLGSTAKSLRRTRRTDELDDPDDTYGYVDTFDPSLTGFAVDDLDEKLERAAASARTGSTSTTVLDHQVEAPADRPADSTPASTDPTPDSTEPSTDPSTDDRGETR
jgi:hypothetical protein